MKTPMVLGYLNEISDGFRLFDLNLEMVLGYFKYLILELKASYKCNTNNKSTILYENLNAWPNFKAFYLPFISYTLYRLQSNCKFSLFMFKLDDSQLRYPFLEHTQQHNMFFFSFKSFVLLGRIECFSF